MPIAGGHADKSGNRFEAYWGVQAILRILMGQVNSMGIESVLEDDTIEFTLSFEDSREAWQIKRQTARGTWSIAELNSRNVLSFLRKRFEEKRIAVFASMADAPALRELTERAGSSASLEEFLEQTKAENINKYFDQFKDKLNIDNEGSFEILNNTQFRFEDERTLIESLDCAFATICSEPQTARKILFAFYFESVGKILDKDAILDCLKSNKILIREEIRQTVRIRIEEQTLQYHEFQKSRLIGKQLIEREVACQIVDQILNSPESQNIYVKGEAGCGKSGVLFEILSGLKKNQIPTLAFRLDRLTYTPSTIELGKQLNLTQSPPVALRTAFDKETKTIVLLIDQLDCMSTVSGRHSEFFETFHAMLNEVDAIRFNMPRSIHFHVIVACRSFDFDNDSRFQRLVDKNSGNRPCKISEKTVSKLSENEIQIVLRNAGYDIALFQKQQIELLSLPIRLALFCQLPVESKKIAFQTQNDIYDAFWNCKREVIERTFRNDEWIRTIQVMCEQMSNLQELSVSELKLDDIPSHCRSLMCSEGVIVKESRRYSFIHETFFDYCFARILISKGVSFVETLENDDQHLFRRAQLRQYLTYLRDEDYTKYIDEVDRLLKSGKILSHLKYLGISMLLAWTDIRNEEWSILQPYILESIEDRRNNTLQINSIQTHIFFDFTRSPSVYHLEQVGDLINQWLNSTDKLLEDLACWFLRMQLFSGFASRIGRLLLPYVDRGENWRKKVNEIIQFTPLRGNRELFELFLKLVSVGFYDEELSKGLNNIHIIHNLPARWLIELIATRFSRILKGFVVEFEHYIDSPLQRDDAKMIGDTRNAATKEPEFFLDQLFPYIIPLAEKYQCKKHEHEMVHDAFWGSLGLDANMNSEIFMDGVRQEVPVDGEEGYVLAFQDAFVKLGKEHSDKILGYIEQLKHEKYAITNHLLFFLYGTTPECFADEAISLVVHNTERANSHNRTVEAAIKACSQYCDYSIYEQLEKKYIEFFAKKDELFRERGTRQYSLYALKSLEQSRLKLSTLKMMEEWHDDMDKKYPKVRVPENVIRDSFFGGEPVDLSDQEWLDAFANESASDLDMRGLAFEKTVQQNPSHYVQLIKNNHPVAPKMVESLLNAIREADIPKDEKYRLIRFAMQYKDTDCQRAFLWLVKSIAPYNYDQDVVSYIAEIAVNSASDAEDLWKPERGGYYGGDIFTTGINTPRGAAICFFYQGLCSDRERFEPIILRIIDNLVAIESDSILANVFLLLIELSKTQKEITFKLADRLIRKVTSQVLATTACQDMLLYLLWHGAEEAMRAVNRLLDATEQISENEDNDSERLRLGGRLALIARLHHDTPGTRSLMKKAMQGRPATRQGIAFCAANALSHSDSQQICVDTLKILFNDENKDVRRFSAGCFQSLADFSTINDLHNELINSFIDSLAFFDEFDKLLGFLCEHKLLMISHSIRVLDTLLKYYLSCHENGSTQDKYFGYVEKLAYRIYATSTDREERKQILGLINSLYECHLVGEDHFRSLDR